SLPAERRIARRKQVPFDNLPGANDAGQRRCIDALQAAETSLNLRHIASRERVVVIEVGRDYIVIVVTQVRPQPAERCQAQLWIKRMDKSVLLVLRERPKAVVVFCRQCSVDEDIPREIRLALGEDTWQAGELEDLEPQFEPCRFERVSAPVESRPGDFLERVLATIAESGDQEMTECHRL